MNNELLLSIIIPCYNVEKYINKCLSSCLNQGLDNSSYEIIAIDDGSQDNTLELLQTFVKSNSQIHLQILKQDNAGQSSARNHGLEYAMGKYILYLDSDDYFVENTISQIIDVAESDNLDMVWFDHQHVDEGNNVLPLPIADCKDYVPTNVMSGTDFIKHAFNHSGMVWQFLFRRNFLVENRILFYDGIIMQDIVYSLQCLYKCNLIKYCPICVYNYLIRANSVTRDRLKKRKRSLDGMQVAALMNDTFKNSNDEELKAWVNDFMNGIVQFNLRRLVKYDDIEGYELCISKLKQFNLLPLPKSFVFKQNCLTWILNSNQNLYRHIVRFLP